MARRFGRDRRPGRRRRGSGHAARQPGVVADDPDQPQAAVADDAGAEQRGRRHGGHAGRQTVDEPGRRHRVLGEAAVDVPAGEQRVLAEVLLAARAEAAGLVGLVQPRHADAVAGGERRRARLAARRDALGAGSERDDLADDLMAGHHGRAVRRQLALEDVQVGAADAAGQHPQQDLARTRLGHRELDEPERRLRRRSRRRQLHRAHRRRHVGRASSLSPFRAGLLCCCWSDTAAARSAAAAGRKNRPSSTANSTHPATSSAASAMRTAAPWTSRATPTVTPATTAHAPATKSASEPMAATTRTSAARKSATLAFTRSGILVLYPTTARPCAGRPDTRPSSARRSTARRHPGPSGSAASRSGRGRSW